MLFTPVACGAYAARRSVLSNPMSHTALVGNTMSRFSAAA